ncbi:MAG: TonB family protein, partial [Terriglobales bacterium]
REAVEVELTKNAAAYWSRCAQRFAIRGASIAASSGIFGPITIGFSRKLVLLPLSMVSGVSEEDLQTVIAHEFAHIGRNDYAKNFIYELLTLPANYHPIFWLTRERVMESREILCDQIASEIGGPTQYGRSLLRLAALLIEGQSTRAPHAIGIFDSNTFERRVMTLTRKRNQIRGARRFAIVAACAVFGMGTCGAALAMSMHVDSPGAAGDNSTPAKSPSTVHVSPKTMVGNLLYKIQPKYPADAKKARIQGTVVLNAEIGGNGRVKNLTVASGPKELRKSSLDAVRQWRYKPFLLNGSPVEVETTVTVTYTLQP